MSGKVLPTFPLDLDVLSKLPEFELAKATCSTLGDGRGCRRREAA